MTQYQAHIMRENLQLMDGGYLTQRDRHYVVLPRHTNQHTIDAGTFFEAQRLGLAVMDNKHNVHVTEQGWAFCGLA